MFYPKRVPNFVDTLFPQFLWRIRSQALYLTIDDSPSEYTPELIELLDRYQTKATFFLIGKNIDTYPDYAELIVKNNHQIANHTFSHSRNLSKDFFREEVLKTQRLLSTLKNDHLNRDLLFRFPYGWFNLSSITVLNTLGLTPVMWSLLCADFDENYSTSTVLQLLLSARAGDIVVLHDNNKSIKKLRQVLPIALEALSAKFQFQKL